MRQVRLTLPGRDCLAIDVGRNLRQVAMAVSGTVVALLVALRADATTRFGGWELVLAMMVVVAGMLVALRAWRTQRRIVVKTRRGLLLDGDPLEFARLELRVQGRRLAAPRYELTLWVMTLGGPDELPLGAFSTLVEASRTSGELEEFLQRGSFKPHRVS